LLLRRISSVGCRRGDEMLIQISLCTSEMDVTIICLLWGFTIKVKHLHRTELVGVSLRLFPTRLAIVLGLRMIYLFEFLPFNSLNAARVAAVARTRTLIVLFDLSTNFTIPCTCNTQKNIMEDLYFKSVVAHAMDKIRFELQNYFKDSRSK
jgi:hypothetical protein